MPTASSASSFAPPSLWVLAVLTAFILETFGIAGVLIAIAACVFMFR